jgi:hypothetical protein
VQEWGNSPASVKVWRQVFSGSIDPESKDFPVAV